MVEPNFPMPDGYLWQYQFIRLVQSWKNPLLERILHYCTISGSEVFYIAVLPILFWAINKRLGLRIAYVFLSSMYLNGWLKDAFRVIRPVGIPGIVSKYLHTSTGFAMPSGHAQGPMTFYIALSRWVRKPWFNFLALLLILAMGFSRVYFGLHWPMDVLVGWGIGLVVALLGWWIGEWWTYRSYPHQIRLGLAIAIPVAMFVLHTGDTSAGYACSLMGIGVGAVLEEHHLRLELPGELWKRLAALVIGMAGLIALQWIIKWPSGIVFIAIRDLSIGLWATLGAPYVFLRCGLYQPGEEARV